MSIELKLLGNSLDPNTYGADEEDGATDPCPSTVEFPAIPKFSKRIIFQHIPDELLLKPEAEWPPTPPKNVVQALREEFDDPKPSLTECSELAGDDYTSIKTLVSKCWPEARFLLVSKQPVDSIELIRSSVEHNPRVNTLVFANFLKSFIHLINDKEKTYLELSHQTNFLKAASSYPTNRKCPFLIVDADKLYLFLYQLSPNKEDVEEILAECRDPATRQKLAWVLTKNGAHLPEDGESSALSRFIIHLYHLSSVLGEGAFPLLHTALCDSVCAYQQDSRPAELTQIYHSLWMQSGDILYGVEPIWRIFAFYDSVVETLEELPILTSHKEAIDVLLQTYSIDDRLATVLYKTWWYAQYKLGKKEAFAERAVDWLVHDYWHLDLQTMEAVVYHEFRLGFPILPINHHRIESSYYSRQLRP